MTQQQLQYAYWQRMRQLQLYRIYEAGSSENSTSGNSYDNICSVSSKTHPGNWFLNYIEYDAKNLDSQKAAARFQTTTDMLFNVGLCSGVHKGNMALRQLDWYYNDQVEFIIRVKKCLEKGVKYDSIGMTAVSPKITTSNIQDLINNKTYNEFFDIMPFATVDGMNEKGIYASSNVVERRKDIDNSSGFGESTTKCCYSTSLVRFILDRLDRLDDNGESLRALLDSLHLFSIRRDLMDYETHILVADAKGNSKIIEFVNKGYELTDYPVLTNFRTNDGFKLVAGTQTEPDWNSIEWNGIGVERWCKGMEFVNTQGVAELPAFKEMRDKLNYIRAYERPYGSETWLTDNLSSDLSVIEAKQYHDDENFRTTERGQKFNEVLAIYKDMNDHRQRVGSNKTWITTHSAIYDLSALSCNLMSQMGTDECTEWNILPNWTIEDVTVIPTSGGKWTLVVKKDEEIQGIYSFNYYDQTTKRWYTDESQYDSYVEYSGNWRLVQAGSQPIESAETAADAKHFSFEMTPYVYDFTWSES